MTTTDVPIQVLYGQIVGRFVSFLADTADAGTVPDEVPLDGTVTLVPLTPITRWPTTTPPRLAVAQTVVARVVAGDLYPPEGNDPGVWVIATDQPAGQPSQIQWRAKFKLDGVADQPADVIFNVPSGGTVDLSQIATVPPAPGTVLVVSHQDALDAEAAADRAEAAAVAAENEHGTLLTADPAHPGLYLMEPSHP